MLKKILNNATLMSWASYIVRFGSFIIVLPLLIKKYSQEELNIYLFLQNSLIGFALLAESGFGSVLIRAVSYFKAGANYLPRTKEEFDNDVQIKNGQPNAEMLTKLFSTSNIIYTLLIGIIVILYSTVGVLMTWNIMKQAGHRLDLWAAFVIVGFYCVVLLQNVRWKSISSGLGFIAKSSKYATFNGSIRVLIFVVILTLGFKPYMLFLFFLLEGISNNYFIRSIVVDWFKENNIVVKKRWLFDKNIFKSLWAASWKVGGIHWGNWLLIRGNSVIVAQVPDPALITSYLLTERFFSIITQISRISFFSNIPTVYNLAAKKDYFNLKRKASGYLWLSIILLCFASAILMFFGNTIIGYIGKEKHLLPFAFLFIMVVTEILDMHASCHAGIYQSTNHIPFLIPTIISGVVLFLSGYYIVMPIYGLFGIIVNRLVVQLSFNHWYSTSLSLKLLKWPFYKYIYELPLFGTKYIYERFKYLIKRT